MIKIIKNISLAVILICLATELLLRFFIISPTNTQADDELGWRYIPYTKILQSSEGFTRISMDQNGLNNDADMLTSNDEAKIVVLGDSYTEALQIQRDENFVALADSGLSCTEFYNAGRAGASFLHYPVLLTRLQQQFDVDQALIIVSPGDFQDTVSAKYTIERVNDKITSVILKTIPRSKLRDKLDAVIFENSALATYLKLRLKALQENKKASAKLDRSELYNKENMERVTSITTHLLSAMQTTTQLKILFLPSYDYHAGRRVELKADSTIASDFFRSIASELRIDFIEASGLDAFYIKHGQPPIGFANKSVLTGHLNRDGHRIIADNIVSAYQSFCRGELNSNASKGL